MSSNPQKLSPTDFASKIRSKYPGLYDDLDDLKLTRRILSKHNQYKDMVDLPDLDQPLDATTVENEAKKFGLSITSGLRSPQKNKAVGGAENSYHLTDKARDASGDRAKQKEFYDYMRDTYGGRMPEILDEQDHIHIAFEGGELENKNIGSGDISKAGTLARKLIRPSSMSKPKTLSIKPKKSTNDELLNIQIQLKRLEDQRSKIASTLPSNDFSSLAPLDKKYNELKQEEYRLKQGATVENVENIRLSRKSGLRSQKRLQKESSEYLTKPLETIGKVLDYPTRPIQAASTALNIKQRALGNAVNAASKGDFNEMSKELDRVTNIILPVQDIKAIGKRLITGEQEKGTEQPVGEALGLYLEKEGFDSSDPNVQALKMAAEMGTDPTNIVAIPTGLGVVGKGVRKLLKRSGKLSEASTGVPGVNLLDRSTEGKPTRTRLGKEEISQKTGQFINVQEPSKLQVEAPVEAPKPSVEASKQAVDRASQKTNEPNLSNIADDVTAEDIALFKAKEGEGYRKPGEDLKDFYNRQMLITAPERRVSFDKFKEDYELALSKGEGFEPGELKTKEYKTGAKVEIPKEELIERGIVAGEAPVKLDVQSQRQKDFDELTQLINKSIFEDLEKGTISNRDFNIPENLETSKPSMTPEGSGTSVISNEELNRTEKFYKVSKSGNLTYQGKQPDATLREGEAVVAIKPNGEMRVSNGSEEVLRKYGDRVKEAAGIKENIKPVESPIEIPLESSSRKGIISPEENLRIIDEAKKSKIETSKIEERSFPISLEESGLVGGSDRFYKVAPNSETVKTATNLISEKGIDGVIEHISTSPTLTPESVAAGTKVIDDLYSQFTSLYKTSPEEALKLVEKADKLAENLSVKLTEYGQAIQAASLVEELSTQKAVKIGQAILEKAKPGTKLSSEQKLEISSITEKIKSAKKELSELEVKIDESKSKLSKSANIKNKAKENVTSSISNRTEKTKEIGSKNKFFTTEQKQKDLDTLKKFFTSAAKGERLGSGLPGEAIEAATRIGAYYLEAGARNVADWSARMVEELGEEIKPYLDDLKIKSYELLKKERSEKRIPSTIKPLDAIDEIKEEIKANRELERKATLSEKKTFKTKERESVKGLKEIERNDKNILAKEVREQKKLLNKETRRIESEQKKEIRREEKDKLRWNYDIRQNSKKAQSNLNSSTSLDPISDITDIATEKLTKIGKVVDNKPYEFQTWYNELEKSYGNQFTDNWRDIFQSSYDNIKSAKETFKESQKAKTLSKLEDETGISDEVELQKLIEKQKDLRKSLQKERQNLANLYEDLDKYGSFKRKLSSSMGILRSIKASIDLSAAGRQGGILSITHPNIARKAFKEQLKALTKNSEKYREFENANLISDPLYDVARKNGVDFTVASSTGASTLNVMEEAFMTDFFQKWAASDSKIKRTLAFPVARSEQAYVTFLNQQRLNVFKLYHDSLLSRKDLSAAQLQNELKIAAEGINKMTGRGSLGKAENIAPLLNSAIFAPKWIASRFQLLNPLYYSKLSSPARRMVIADILKFTSVVATTTFLIDRAGKAGYIDAETSLNPDDPDFLKIRVGKTHYDLTSGFQPQMRVLFRLFKRVEDRKSGELVKQRGKLYKDGEYQATEGKILDDFFRSKMAPLPGYGYDFWFDESMERDEMGRKKKFEFKRDTLNLVEPIIFSDLTRAYKEGGTKELIKATPSLLGVGVTTYEKRKN